MLPSRSGEKFSMLNLPGAFTLQRKHASLVIKGLPFGARMAQMLVKISLDLRLTKHASLWPNVNG